MPRKVKQLGIFPFRVAEFVFIWDSPRKQEGCKHESLQYGKKILLQMRTDLWPVARFHFHMCLQHSCCKLTLITLVTDWSSASQPVCRDTQV